MRTTLLLIAAILFTPNLHAQAKNPKRKPNPVFAPVKDDPKLPRVLLIGDSISIGYTLPTREFLKGKANLHRIPTNGGPTTKGLASIEAWLGKGKWDVIHFNWGLHDLKYMGPKGQNLFPKEKGGKPQVAIEAYEENLEKLVLRLKKTGTQLIWRNTTPVPPGAKGRYVGDSIKYNAAAARVMKKHGIAINDLNALTDSFPVELFTAPGNVHFKTEGSRKLGQAVAGEILEALGR